MTKYSFVLLTGEKEGFLEQLQELGVVDISRSEKPVDSDSSVMFHKAERARKTIEFLEGIDYSKDADAEAIAKATVNVDGDPVDFVQSCRSKLAELSSSLTAALKQKAARLPWGEYDKKALDGLKELGYTIRYYCVDAKKFDEKWGELYPLQVVSEEGKKVWFVTVSHMGEAYSFPVPETAAPEGTYADAVRDIEQIKSEIISCKAGLLNAKDYIPAIKEACNNDLVEFDRYLANEAGEGAAEDMITVFTGFAPVENDQELAEAFDKIGVLYIKEDASQEDNPPIKLKNNWFTRQFEVFTEMYGMPVYTEFDPTPIVAPFYLLFFAMCMGDAGYGIVLLIMGLMLNKGWLKIDMFKGLGNIIALLGIGTFFVGTILGTFFGMSLISSDIPQELKQFIISGDVELFGSTYNKQMILALAIGVVHISVAMTVKAINNTFFFGFKESLSAWGWWLVVVGGVIVGTLSFLSVIPADVSKWALIAIGGLGAVGIYLLNSFERNVFLNIGAGLWDTYNMASGLLGDILSYIRLFALGLAGGMLGETFNSLALMLVEGQEGVGAVFGWIGFGLIIVFGHTLNIAMSCLSAFVHPLRLTFVEYFKNAGYDGKGVEYKPFSKN